MKSKTVVIAMIASSALITMIGLVSSMATQKVACDSDYGNGER